MAEIAAEYRVGIVCSHDMVVELATKAERMVALGVAADGILLDPTHDFGENTWHGLELMCHCDRFVETGWPVLMALSHKDFIGETLGVDLDGRFEGTLAATTIAAWHGARVFRAHDVSATRRACDMVASISGRRLPTRTVRALA